MSDTDTRPWRKRRPILSRVVLFGIAGALAFVLLTLWNQRKDEDRFVRLRAELTSFDVVIGTPGGADAVLQFLDEKFSDPELPRDIRVTALRWEAMALRRNAAAGDRTAAEAVEPTYERALALATDPNDRYGLTLERVEGRLEAGEPEFAIVLLAAAHFPREGPWALLSQHYLGMAQALSQEPAEAAARIEATLAAWKPPLPLEPSVTAGGRTWNLPEIATVTTERLTALYAELEQNTLPLWRRLSHLVEHHTPSQIICAKRLVALGDDSAAISAWLRARRADPDDARAWAEADPVIRDLRARADG